MKRARERRGRCKVVCDMCVVVEHETLTLYTVEASKVPCSPLMAFAFFPSSQLQGIIYILYSPFSILHLPLPYSTFPSSTSFFCSLPPRLKSSPPPLNPTEQVVTTPTKSIADSVLLSQLLRAHTCINKLQAAHKSSKKKLEEEKRNNRGGVQPIGDAIRRREGYAGAREEHVSHRRAVA
ncbi:hypothetical protein VNO78_22559 [Psophocarpus tetragonolobus]|uniref:Uncharacterized protein n=1 Tax=Psophocarpus tetragonolobus TaxID=3891 RepID=A0AAN9S273_PSOTE